MPVANNKYSVQVTNRFQLADSDNSSGSEDEACQNVDPYAMVKQAEADAIKQAKLKVKEQSKVQVKIITQVAKEEPEKKQDNRPKTNRREPRANQAPRRGPRTERVQDGDNALSENNNNSQAARDDGDRRAQRRPRNQDRRSGNPRAGIKATEKRGGHGAGNWGKPTEAPSDFEETKPEQQTPEENSAENTENADPEKEAEKEPEEITMTLEEYYAQEQSEAPAAPTGVSRKANNGEVLKGKVIRKNKIYIERKVTSNVREQSNKNIVPNEQLAFVSGRQRNYRYNDNERNNNERRPGGGRRNDNKGGNRGDRKQEPAKDFSKPQTMDFPELGK